MQIPCMLKKLMSVKKVCVNATAFIQMIALQRRDELSHLKRWYLNLIFLLKINLVEYSPETILAR